MRLGFFYHITVYQDKANIYVPEYIGLFIDELANNNKELLYFAYTSSQRTTEQNYLLKHRNINLVDLGVKKIFPVTILKGHFSLMRLKEQATYCDAILVRAPSPLAPFFYTAFSQFTKVNYLMVGDYIEGIKHQNFHFFKQLVINFFTYINEFFQNRAIRRTGCLVNSAALADKYKKLNNNIQQVKTTTLTSDRFFFREDTCSNPDDIKLLFIGRIERAKGMDELIEVFISLRRRGFPVSLHLAGWDTEVARDYFSVLQNSGLDKNTWKYHGLLAGDELFKLYRESDIFILPSYHEGFPRVIWEAMANSLPVITTTVGSIPQHLKHNIDTILVLPQEKEQLLNAVVTVIQEQNLRKRLIINGRELAKDCTLEKQTRKIVKYIYAKNLQTSTL